MITAEIIMSLCDQFSLERDARKAFETPPAGVGASWCICKVPATPTTKQPTPQPANQTTKHGKK